MSIKNGLRIVKKTNSKCEEKKQTKAIITILGLVGQNDNHKKAQYYFEWKKEIKEEYSTFPLLIKNFSKDYEIVPIFTKEAKEANLKVLKKEDLEFDNFKESCLIKDDKDFEDIFKIINEAISSYDEVIVDVSHGFRHLPILMIVDLIIQNFQDTKKISKILFAKEIETFKEYEIIDLKEYLDLANISFVLTTFAKNYTVASHIKSDKYKDLIEKLNSFSNDLMALNQNNLFNNTSKELLIELDKIENISIKKQADDLKKAIKKLTDYDDKNIYKTYYNLAKDLFEKKYMLLSLTLLYESMRLYATTDIKRRYKEIIEKIEETFNNDLYAIGDYIIKLKNDKNSFRKRVKDKGREISILINEDEFNKIKNSFPKNLVEKEFKDFPFSLIDRVADTRNNLAHANSDNRTFKDIEKDIKVLFDKYYNKCIKEPSMMT
ncbi:TM1812 family CRISPR-associated protein [Aliarcobacter lanthieri]|uniref:TM1812 family CRISPR-associated protein n=1 Tax=Aliarcobacter lanthieri TaxID=1355374 RepID=UPI003AAF684B